MASGPLHRVDTAHGCVPPVVVGMGLPETVDLFATHLNCRIPNFVSPFEDPEVIATDAFLYNWDYQDLYAFPPLPLIRKVLNKLWAWRNTRFILIAPFWPQEWFPDVLQASIELP